MTMAEKNEEVVHMAQDVLSSVKRFLEGVGSKEWNSKSPDEKEEHISTKIDEMIEGMAELSKTKQSQASKELDNLKRTHENSKNHLQESKRKMKAMGEQIETAHTALRNLEEAVRAKRRHSEPINLLSISFVTSYLSRTIKKPQNCQDDSNRPKRS